MTKSFRCSLILSVVAFYLVESIALAQPEPGTKAPPAAAVEKPPAAPADGDPGKGKAKRQNPDGVRLPELKKILESCAQSGIKRPECQKVAMKECMESRPRGQCARMVRRLRDDGQGRGNQFMHERAEKQGKAAKINAARRNLRRQRIMQQKAERENAN